MQTGLDITIAARAVKPNLRGQLTRLTGFIMKMGALKVCYLDCALTTF
jgi:hypothetical protein